MTKMQHEVQCHLAKKQKQSTHELKFIVLNFNFCTYISGVEEQIELHSNMASGRNQKVGQPARLWGLSYTEGVVLG